MDVKGSGSITDLSDSVLTIWRNKKKEEKLASLAFTQEKPDEDLINTPDSVIYCSKQRNGEWEGKAGVYWNGNAMQFTNKASERPRMYVKYSSPAPPRTEEEEVI
jgi:twinkle protein